MMDKEKILLQEGENDGQSIFLYYDETVGVYLAFGLSAYYSTMVASPFVSFSDALQMPVALLRKGHVNSLRQSLLKVEHEAKCFYRFRLRTKVGDSGYERWMERSLEKTKL